MVVIGGADGDPGGGVARPAGAGVVVGVGVGDGAGVGVDVGVVVGVGVGVEVGVGVGVGVGSGFTDRLQLSVRKLIRRRENARKQLLRFRFIAKKPFKTRFKPLYLGDREKLH
jgi:hypothetical protein